MATFTKFGSHPARRSAGFRWSGYLIGIALGGFFDGILLHQVLQWHHLLSLVDSPLLADIRAQILADGLFHVLMYLIAVGGLALLWRRRAEFSEAGAGALLFACVLLGFGAWNLLDVALFHWILVIHRIRVNVPNPMLWDLLWLVLFSLPFLLAGWLLRQRIIDGPSGPSGPGGRGNAPACLITAITLGAGALAALPSAQGNATLVMFAPGTTPAQAFRAFDAADARLLWVDRSATVWAVRTPGRGDAMRLYRHGALLVSGSMLAPGCWNWLRAS